MSNRKATFFATVIYCVCILNVFLGVMAVDEWLVYANSHKVVHHGFKKPHIVLQKNETNSSPIPRNLKVEKVLSKCVFIPKEDLVRITNSLIDISNELKVDPVLVAVIMYGESKGSHTAISCNRTSIGMMQINMKVWQHRWDPRTVNYFDPIQNIRMGATLLSEFTHKHGLREGLQVYAGKGAVYQSALDMYLRYK